MKCILFFISFVFVTTRLDAQYWFGPKVGFSYIDHVYEDSDYEEAYKVPINYNYQAGVAVSYTTPNERYSIYGEVLFQRIGKKIEDIQEGSSVLAPPLASVDEEEREEIVPLASVSVISAKMTNHFISVPVMFRVIFGNSFVHYYVNGGPRLVYWTGGSGTRRLAESNIRESEGDENEEELDYSVVFRSSKLEGSVGQDLAYVSRANRIQFSLTAGAGFFVDLAGNSRLQIDLRYVWGHSNMGLNNENRDTNFEFATYRENFEYFNNIATIGVAYMWGYDGRSRKQGRSTLSRSNKRKKK